MLQFRFTRDGHSLAGPRWEGGLCISVPHGGSEDRLMRRGTRRGVAVSHYPEGGLRENTPSVASKLGMPNYPPQTNPPLERALEGGCRQSRTGPGRVAPLSRPLVPMLLLAALAGCGLETTSTSTDSGSSTTQATLDKPWYVSDSRVLFNESAGTFEVGHYIDGAYRPTEMGDFVNDGVPGMLHGMPTADLMGGMGLSDNGLPFSIDLVAMNVSNLIFVDDLGATVTLSEHPPELEDSPITDDFSDDVLHGRWWTGGSVVESGGKLRLQGDSAAAGLWQLGFRTVQSVIALESAGGQCNAAIGYHPWDEDIEAKCGIAVSEEGSTTVFGQIHNIVTGESLHYVDLVETNIGASHECKMTWNGGSLEFHADGALVDSYTPVGQGNLQYCGEPSFYVWGNAIATVDDFRVAH